jgi:hypothetical protein
MNRLQLVYLLAAFIEKDEWVYVSKESLLDASKRMVRGDPLIEIEEDELNDRLIIRLPEEENE